MSGHYSIPGRTHFSLDHLAEVLQLRASYLVHYARMPLYEEFTIKKKNGTERTIHSPQGMTRVLQKKLEPFLDYAYSLIIPDCAHAFIKTRPGTVGCRGIATNAAKHVDKEFVLNIDLKDFFKTVDCHRVLEIFENVPFKMDKKAATVATMLTTYMGSLPVGAITSPVISNLACQKLDRYLTDFSAQVDFVYTRYADDMTFSMKKEPHADHLRFIRDLIIEMGFTVNESKTRLQSKTQRQSVTGLTVNEKVNVNRRYIRKIRAMLNDWTNSSLLLATMDHFGTTQVNRETMDNFMYRLGGMIDFVGNVRGKNDPVYVKLWESYDLQIAIEKSNKY